MEESNEKSFPAIDRVLAILQNRLNIKPREPENQSGFEKNRKLHTIARNLADVRCQHSQTSEILQDCELKFKKIQEKKS